MGKDVPLGANRTNVEGDYVHSILNQSKGTSPTSAQKLSSVQIAWLVHGSHKVNRDFLHIQHVGIFIKRFAHRLWFVHVWVRDSYDITWSVHIPTSWFARLNVEIWNASTEPFCFQLQTTVEWPRRLELLQRNSLLPFIRRHETCVHFPALCISRVISSVRLVNLYRNICVRKSLRYRRKMYDLDQPRSKFVVRRLTSAWFSSGSWEFKIGNILSVMERIMHGLEDDVCSHEWPTFRRELKAEWFEIMGK